MPYQPRQYQDQPKTSWWDTFANTLTNAVINAGANAGAQGLVGLMTGGPAGAVTGLATGAVTSAITGGVQGAVNVAPSQQGVSGQDAWRLRHQGAEPRFEPMDYGVNLMAPRMGTQPIARAGIPAERVVGDTVVPAQPMAIEHMSSRSAGLRNQRKAPWLDSPRMSYGSSLQMLPATPPQALAAQHPAAWSAAWKDPNNPTPSWMSGNMSGAKQATMEGAARGPQQGMSGNYYDWLAHEINARFGGPKQ